MALATDTGQVDSRHGGEVPGRLTDRAALFEIGRGLSRQASPWDLMVIGLDRLGTVNLRSGYHSGDALVDAVWGFLQASAAHHGAGVFRLSGHEFVLIADEGFLTGSASAVLEALDELCKMDDAYASCRISAGLAKFPQHGHSFEAVLAAAESARRIRKGRRESGVMYCNDSILRKNALTAALHRALRGNDSNSIFYYAYQPIVSLRSGATAGFEALARWTRKGEPVPPADFVPIAEDSASISVLSDQLLLDLCEALRLSPTDISFSLNWSASQLDSGTEVSDFITRCAALGITPRRLIIEITESSLLHATEAVQDNLRALRARGFRIALDDFGTGYSGLSYLRDFPIDRLKVDRSFTRESMKSASARTILEHLIGLAHELSIEVVAEGIEEEQQLDLVRALSCDFAQGFLLGGPSRQLSIRTDRNDPHPILVRHMRQLQ